MDKLPKCRANYVPLTPITFLKRAASVYANRASVIYQGTRFTWQQTYERCLRLAASLRYLKIVKNDVVSVLAPTVPALYEMHFAVPMAGAILNTINTRLDAKNVAIILSHSKTKIFFVDYQYVPLAREALRLLIGDERKLQASESTIPLVVVIDDIDSPTGVRLGELEYEQLVHKGNPSCVPIDIEDEWDPIALNYTSATTSEPKGVVYSHRGAYLSTLSLVLGWEMGNQPVYLWLLPMLHCNGWTFTWALAARGGTIVCIRNTTALDIYRNICRHKVTHMCCAPIVFNILLEAKFHEKGEITSPVQVLTGGAPPPASLIERMELLGFHITHAYGLTEATGPALVCECLAKWNQLPANDQAKLKARRGVSIPTLADVDVKDIEKMVSLPRGGVSVGEIVLRGSSIMKGYYKDLEATSKTFKNGWFLTGDFGFIHRDGYIEIKDQLKDVIISGGKNISSVELESVLYRHPRILEAAAVAMPHSVWGESPCAFIALKQKPNGEVDDIKESDIIEYSRENLPRYMVPKKVVFLPELPKTSTGKIQKFQLRALAKTFEVSGQKLRSKNSTDRTGKVNNGVRGYDVNPHAQILALSRL